MSADFATARVCLQENLVALAGNKTTETSALWNISNALLVLCDALESVEIRVASLGNPKT